MVDKDHHYPRQGNKPSPAVYSTLDRFGDPIHTLYGGQPNLGGCRTGCGTWWPDFGPTVRDFSPGGIHHPTEHVFSHEVIPFTRSQSMPNQLDQVAPPRRTHETHVQFRHPAPSTEALWSSVDVMPYKKAGRRKCGEASNWRAALSSGAEGCKHGGRMPIWCKGPLLDNPDFHQQHPLKRGEVNVNISNTCLLEQLAAGGATGTSPVDALLRSSKSTKHADLGKMGLRDAETMVADMTIDASRHLSHGMTFKHAGARLNGNEASFRTMNSPLAVKDRDASFKSGVSFDPSVDSFGSDTAGPADKLPNWVAPRTVATRDLHAAGGQASRTAIRRTALPARPRGMANAFA